MLFYMGFTNLIKSNGTFKDLSVVNASSNKENHLKKKKTIYLAYGTVKWLKLKNKNRTEIFTKKEKKDCKHLLTALTLCGEKKETERKKDFRKWLGKKCKEKAIFLWFLP